MLLGFARRFVPFVEDGSKTHTIRAMRRHAPRVGELCHCYANPRQKSMRLIGRFPCVRVQEIQITETPPLGLLRPALVISIDGEHLSFAEASEFAYRDGFRTGGRNAALSEMLAHWRSLHGAPHFPLHGHLIHWRRV